jgi:hypothetical protein
MINRSNIARRNPMGRPIKKSYIGNTSISGQQIACYAWVPGDVQSRLSYIDEQLGTGRYHVVSSDGSNEGIVTLVNTDGGNLIAGQGSVTVSPFPSAGGGTKYAEVIYDNVVRTFDGTKYIWYFSNVSDTGEVNGANIQSS